MALRLAHSSAFALISCLIILAPRSVMAASDESEVDVHAQFEQARSQMNEGHYDDASHRLDALLRANPSAVGVRYQLAVCYEKLGRTASAWQLYGEVAEASHAKSQSEREQAARASANAIYARVPHLTVAVPTPSDEQRVEIDGTPLPRERWGVAQAIDPGEHTVTATSPGNADWRRAMTIREGEGLTVVVLQMSAPALAAREPASPLPAQAPEHEAPSGSWRRTAGWIGIASGGAALVAGSVLGLVSHAMYDDSGCSSDGTKCPAGDASAKQSRALAYGDASTGFFIAGGVLAVSGVVLVLTAPSRANAARVDVTPLAMAAGGGAQIRATW